MKIVQAFEDSNILLKGGFSSMLFDTLELVYYEIYYQEKEL